MVKFYKVGGCVRDEILNRKCKDFDYSVEAGSFEEMKDELRNRNAEIFLELPEYLTVKAKLDGEVCDFVLCRKDGAYYDGRRPESVSMGTIYDDLQRRDFTMNAIAKSSDEYLDPHNGVHDINERVIRCVGNASDRISEDYLRALRAIRFSIVLGFRIEARLASEIHECGPNLCKVSSERIYEELRKCFQYDTLKTLGVLRRFNLENYVFVNGLRLDPTFKK